MSKNAKILTRNKFKILDMMLPIAIQTGPRSDRFSTLLRVLEPRVRAFDPRS